MEFRGDRPTALKQLSALPSPVDISRIEASDSVQSYLSTSTSSKRIRISTTSSTPFVDNDPEIGLLESFSEYSESAHPESPMRTITSSIQALLLLEFAHLPSGRSTRLERSWSKYIIKYTLLCYCFLSCIMASTHLYIGLFHGRVNGKTIMEPGGISVHSFCLLDNISQEVISTRTVEQYLLKSTTPSYTLEPFILSANQPMLNKVTICAWLSESEIHQVGRWLESWHGIKIFASAVGTMLRRSPGPSSLLVTTASTPTSPSHANLLEKISAIRTNFSKAGLSIHLLHVNEKSGAASPNLYLNLARTFVSTNWTLLFPGTLELPIPQSMQKALDKTNWEAETGVHLLHSNSSPYPFQGLPSLLIRNDLDFWCTERSFIGVSRESDWDECLWQISLAMTGKISMIEVGPLGTVETERDYGFEVCLSD